MVRKKNNGYVEMKVLTAVLEERFKNQREHFEERFKEIRTDFEKGGGRMKEIEEKFTPLKENIEKNSRALRDIKVIVGTIASIFGAVGGFISFLLSKFIK